ncbi:hypothetical protein NKH18_30955 [Streptomyces sp. M10(2022)]
MLRHSDAIGAGLPPDDAVVLDAPDPLLRTAVAAAVAGDHGPARELLAATRRHAQWERRDEYVRRLAGASLNHHGWLDSWLEGSPRTPTRSWSRPTPACCRRGRYVRAPAPRTSNRTSSRPSSRSWTTPSR